MKQEHRRFLTILFPCLAQRLVPQGNMEESTMGEVFSDRLLVYCVHVVHPIAESNGARVFTDRVDLQLVSVKTYPSGVMRVCYRFAQ